MRVSIDGAGRVVIPKRVREELGLRPGQELDLDAREGDIRLSVPGVEMWVEGRGREARVVTASPMPPLTDETLRATLEAVRDRR